MKSDRLDRGESKVSSGGALLHAVDAGCNLFSVTFYPHLRLIGGGSTWHPCHVFCIVCASEKGTIRASC